LPPCACIGRLLFDNNEYKKLKYGYVVNSLNKEFLVIDKKTQEVLDDKIDSLNKTIANTLYQNDIYISKKTEIKTGEYYNQTKYKADDKGISIKDNLPTNLYGYYTSLNPSYACVIKFTKKSKDYQRMIGIPIYYDLQPDKKNSYIKKLLNLKEEDTIEIIKNKIPFYSVIDWDGQICSLVGATDCVEVCNAIEFKIEKEDAIKWKHTLNRLFNKKKNKDLTEEFYTSNLSEIIKYIYNKVINDYKLYSNLKENLKKYLCIESLEILPIETKEQIIIEILKLLKCNSANANFKFLNEKYSSAFGKKNDRIIEHAKIITKSVTGIKEHYYEF
jgi:CRISPR-associated endonuclease Csn1